MKNDALDVFIRDRWKALDITQAEFARRMEKHDSYIEQVRTGDKTFPLDALAQWTTCLQLTPEKTEDFTTICRAAIQGSHRNAWIRDLEMRIEEQAATIANQSERIALLTTKYQELLERLRAEDELKRVR